jgi:hypothetical protein
MLKNSEIITIKENLYREIRIIGRCCVAALLLPLTAVRFQTKKNITINQPAESLISYLILPDYQ